MRMQLRKLSCGLFVLGALCATAQAEVVFTDNFDNTAAGGTYTTGTRAEILAHGWTTVYGTPQGEANANMGTGIAGNSNPPESTFWGNATQAGNTEAALEYAHTNALVCGDILKIEANAIRLTGYNYIEEIILWNGSDPASRVTVTNWADRGYSPPWIGWWSPPQKGQINTLYYMATAADAGKYVIFKYGHGGTWSETADVTFSVTHVTVPEIAFQPKSLVRTEGETATFSVAALGCGLNYQWKKGGAPISGATTSTLTFSPVALSDDAEYLCTISNGSGTTDSQTVRLTVDPKLGGGASIAMGVNFGSSEPFNPSPTAIAYGLHPSRWQDTPPGRWDGSVNEFNLLYHFGAGQIDLSYSANNTYSCWWVINPDLIWKWSLPADMAGGVLPGNAEVNDGYLDDGGTGYSVTLSGLTSSVGFSSYVVRTIAASDNATAFNTVTLTDNYTFNMQDLTYGPVFPANDLNSGKAAVSSTSTALNTDSITLASTRDGTSLTRGSLAGFIITDKPVILAQPQAPSGTLFPGVAFALDADAFGVPPLAYQWFKDGSAIPGATGASYQVASATMADAGTYSVTVTNSYGAAASAEVPVEIIALFSPVITQEPQDKTSYVGGAASFQVAAEGGQLSYQWKKGGVAGTDIPNATNATLRLTGLALTDDSDYTVIVSNPAGTTNATAHLTVLTVPTSGYLGAVLADNPLSLWRLSETAGTLVSDVKGGRDGSYVGAVGLGQPGILPGDTSVNFPNSGWSLVAPTTYAEVQYDPALNPAGPFSVEFWAKPNGIPGDLFSPLSSLNGNANRSGYLFYINAGSGWQFRMGNTDGYIATVSGGTGSAEWQHVVGVYDGTSAYLYVNGVQYGPVVPSGAYAPNNGDVMRIGAPTLFSRPWNGLIDEVAFYNYALTPAQVQNHLLLGVPARVEIASATGILGDHALNNGATWLASDTGRTGVMQFDATNGSQVVVSPYAKLNSAQGTICFWIRMNEFAGTGSEAAMVIDRRNSGGSGTGTIIAIHDGANNTAGTVFFQANPSGANPFSSFRTVNDGAWHHVAVTYGVNLGEVVTMYIDGVWDNQSGNLSAWPWPTGLDLLIGKSRDAYWKKLHGNLDDVRFYDRILTDAEIGQVMTGSVVDAAALALRLDFDASPAAGYRVWTTPLSGTVQSSDAAAGAYTDLGASPLFHVPAGSMKFFRAKLP